MPEADTQERPAAPAERPSEGQGWWGSLKDNFSWAASNVGAAVGLVSDTDNEMNNARLSDNPGTRLMGILAQTDEYKTEEGRAKLANLTNDTAFMGALDKALASDTTILTRMAAAGNQQGGMGATQFIDQLQDPQNRGLMTQVLNKIGENDNDGFGATYLYQVVGSAQTENYSDLNTLLQQGGISDSRVQMAAQFGPMGGMLSTMGNFLRDPNGATRDWINDPNGPMAGLSEDNKNMLAGLVQSIAKFFGMYTGPGGFAAPYIEFGQRLGGELAANGASVRGVANLPSAPTPDGNTGANLVGDSSNPRSGTQLSASFNPLGLNRAPAAEPDAGTAAPQVARVEHQISGRTASGQVMAM